MTCRGGDVTLVHFARDGYSRQYALPLLGSEQSGNSRPAVLNSLQREGSGLMTLRLVCMHWIMELWLADEFPMCADRLGNDAPASRLVREVASPGTTLMVLKWFHAVLRRLRRYLRFLPDSTFQHGHRTGFTRRREGHPAHASSAICRRRDNASYQALQTGIRRRGRSLRKINFTANRR